MKCKISDWCCIYHACMSDDCQKKVVNNQGIDWGVGKCQIKKNKQMEQRYFTKVTQDYWSAKNELQKEAKKLMRSFERKIINANEKGAYVKSMIDAFDGLNRKHSRCKPLRLDFWTPDKDPKVHISGVTELVFYKVAE